MTLRTNARVAGFTYWIYFVAGIAGLLLAGNAPATAVFSLSSPVTWAVWLPLLVFELTFAVWLITKGVAMPAARRAT